MYLWTLFRGWLGLMFPLSAEDPTEAEPDVDP